MKQIQDFYISRMRQEEAYAFHGLVHSEFAKCEGAIGAPFYSYQEAIDRFNEALAPEQGSTITAEIVGFDNRQDSGWSGINNQTQLALKHINAAKVAAATAINNVLKRYGNPRDLPYIQEMGVIKNIIEDLNPLYSQLNTIGASDWFNELVEAHAGFSDAFARRNEEQSRIVTGASAEAREQTDEAYKKCVQRLNAYIIFNETDEYEYIVDIINNLIDYQRSVQARRDTTNKKKKEEENNG